MPIQTHTYKRADSPPVPWFHLSDEDIAAQLDESAKRSRAARKGQETLRQRRVEQVAQEKRKYNH